MSDKPFKATDKRRSGVGDNQPTTVKDSASGKKTVRHTKVRKAAGDSGGTRADAKHKRH